MKRVLHCNGRDPPGKLIVNRDHITHIWGDACAENISYFLMLNGSIISVAHSLDDIGRAIDSVGWAARNEAGDIDAT